MLSTKIISKSTRGKLYNDACCFERIEMKRSKKGLKFIGHLNDGSKPFTLEDEKLVYCDILDAGKAELLNNELVHKLETKISYLIDNYKNLVYYIKRYSKEKEPFGNLTIRFRQVDEKTFYSFINYYQDANKTTLKTDEEIDMETYYEGFVEREVNRCLYYDLSKIKNLKKLKKTKKTNKRRYVVAYKTKDALNPNYYVLADEFYWLEQD